MKKFKVIVTVPVEVEIDENKIDEKWMEKFREMFYDFTELAEHAEHLAQFVVRFPNLKFIEGYGVVKQDSRWPYLNVGPYGYMRADEAKKEYKEKAPRIEEGINVIILNDEVEAELE